MSNWVNKWIWKMAIRESRGSSRSIALFILALSLSICVIVATDSFSRDVHRAIDRHAQKLLGADLIVKSRRPFPPELNQLIHEIPGEKSRQIRFSTMAYFPAGKHSRLAQVRAVEKNFPLYGGVESVPQNALELLDGESPKAIVEDSLLLQFGSKVGDPIRIGEVTFKIAGSLLKIPGETLIVSQLAPRILIPMKYLDATGLLQFGSRAFYQVNFRYFSDFDDSKLLLTLQDFADRIGISFDTINSRKESLGKRLENLFHFLHLVGLTALILGGMGIGSIMQVYVNRKIDTVATLRCLGAKGNHTVFVYLIQVLILGVTGGILGGAFGIGLQKALPWMIQGFLPFDYVVLISWPSIVFGIFISVIASVVFAITPLLFIRSIPPNAALHINYQPSAQRFYSRLMVVLIGMVLTLLYSTSVAHSWKYGFAFSGATIISIAILALLAKLTMASLKFLTPSQLPFSFRQGLSNLYRPQNQTMILIICIGIGTFLVTVLYLSKYQLTNQIKRSGEHNNPNMVLFDIQTDQLAEIKSMLKQHALPLIQSVSIVPMRIASIKGKTIEELANENRHLAKDNQIPNWTLIRDYRSTFRDQLVSSEKLAQGEFIQTASSGNALSIPVSIERGIAKDLKVKLGDRITFDLQGVPITTHVASIRKVDWYKIQPNFFFVFPVGVLEEAPQTHVVVTRVSGSAESAFLQRETVERFHNVSSVDLTLVLDTVNEILNTASFAIEFMAFISILTGLIVFSSSVQMSYLQRLKETVLLKILGASRKKIIAILATEYFALGFLAVNSGLFLAMCGSLALSHFVFETRFSIPWPTALLANCIIIGLIMTIGALNSISMYRRQPLEVLRQET